MSFYRNVGHFQKKSSTAGFTLLEVLVVLGIIGMLAAIIAPRISQTTDYYTMGRNIRDLTSAIRATRALAIEAKEDKVFSINLKEKTFQIEQQKNRSINDEIAIEVFTSDAEIDNTGEIAGIRFYSDGTSSGGRITLSLEKDKRAVDIVWMTGKINVLDLDENDE